MKSTPHYDKPVLFSQIIICLVFVEMQMSPARSISSYANLLLRWKWLGKKKFRFRVIQKKKNQR